MPFNVRLAAVALDCVDPTALAEFYRDFADGEIVFTTEEFVAVSAAGFYLAAVRIPDHRPPTWPEADLPKQMHLDFAVDNLDAAQARAVELGATRVATQPAPDRWRVLLDPAGHPFCVTVAIPV